jgi:hypothetical protein
VVEIAPGIDHGGLMKLNVRNDYPCNVDTWWKMYWDPEFEALLSRGSDLLREVLSEQDSPTENLRRVRFTPSQELPGPVAGLLGSSKLVYEQENRWVKADSVLHWQVFPAVMADKVTAAGKFEVRATQQGCEQIVTGDITVKLRFFGGKIENAVVTQVENSFAAYARAARTWLLR